MATLVSALGGVELPGEVDGDATGIVVLAELRTDVDTAVGCLFSVSSMKQVANHQAK